MATVANAGYSQFPIDKAITPKNLTSPFRPNGGIALVVATTTTSQAVTLPRNPARADDCVRMYNSGTSPVRFRFGSDLTETASLADKAVPPGTVEIFRMNPSTATIAVISNAASTIEIDCGSGL